MSSIEERLERDITAVTGGVVMTESDLRDARGAVDELIASRVRTDRRRGVVEAAAAAVLVVVLGIAAIQTLGGDDETAPPVSQVPTPRTTDLLADFLVGSAPTPELLQGIWRVDNGVKHLRFSAPNVFASDDGGRVLGNPGVHGTYVITGDLITVTVDGGPAGCAGQKFAMRASQPEPGALRVVHTQPGTGECAQNLNSTWILEQMVPTSPTAAELVFSTDAGWQSLVNKSSLYGLWLAEGGGHVLEIDPGGTYYVADDSGKPVDRGQWTLRGGSRLTLTSSAGSARCGEGDQLVLGAVEQINPGTRALRSTVRKNSCGAAWTPAAWILIPHVGS